MRVQVWPWPRRRQRSGQGLRAAIMSAPPPRLGATGTEAGSSFFKPGSLEAPPGLPPPVHRWPHRLQPTHSPSDSPLFPLPVPSLPGQTGSSKDARRRYRRRLGAWEAAARSVQALNSLYGCQNPREGPARSSAAQQALWDPCGALRAVGPQEPLPGCALRAAG